MGLDNPIHIAFLLILLLLVFGAKRLPEMGKSLGSGMRGFKDAISGESHESTLIAHADPCRCGSARRFTAHPSPCRARLSSASGASPPEARGRASGQPENDERERETMATAVGSIGHEDRLSVVDHLQELRGRLIISLAALAVAFGVCMWQNHALLNIINKPLAHETQKQVKAGNGPLGATYTVQQSARTVAAQLQCVVGALQAPGSGVSPATKSALDAGHAAAARRDQASVGGARRATSR